jgi:hypothetical protein
MPEAHLQIKQFSLSWARTKSINPFSTKAISHHEHELTVILIFHQVEDLTRIFQATHRAAISAERNEFADSFCVRGRDVAEAGQTALQQRTS